MKGTLKILWGGFETAAWILLVLYLSGGLKAHATACPAGYTNWTAVTVPHNASLSADISNFIVPITSSSSTTIPLIGFIFCTGNNSGTLLNYELVANVKEWWVMVPTLSKTADQTIWFGANAAGSDMSNKATLWANYRLVMHFCSNPGGAGLPDCVTDSSTNNSPSTVGTFGSASRLGLINGGTELSSANTYWINANAINALTSAVTIETWQQQKQQAQLGFIASNDNATNGYGMYDFNNGNTIQVVNGGSESDARWTCPNGQCLDTAGWHHTAATWNGSNATLTSSYTMYFDGAAKSFSMAATGTSTIGTASTNLVVGRQGTTAGNLISSFMDEVRICGCVLSADWILEQFTIEPSPITITLPNTTTSASAFPVVY